MKSLISCLSIAVLLTVSISAQQVKEKEVPDAVKQSCKEKFPKVKKIEWKLKTDKNYEAEFKLGGVELAVKFSPDGKWLETESGIKSKEVSSAVKEAVTKEFPKHKIIELQSVETAGSKELVYEIHVKKNNEVVKLQYSKDGKQLNKSVKTGK